MHSFHGLLVRSSLVTLCVALFLAPGTRAQSKAERAESCALQNVQLGLGDEAPVKTLLLLGGRIEAILEPDEPLPVGVREIDAAGLIATPALIDAYTAAGCETPVPVIDADKPVSIRANVRIDMRQANRKGVQPAFHAADVLELEDELGKKYRSSGFGALLSAPRKQLLAGTSVLATTRDAARRDSVLAAEVLQHAAFSASGPGYPSTMMGYHAQLRQFFLDAQRHGELMRRWNSGEPGPRPAHDADLEAGLRLLAGEQRIVCEAETHRDIARWIRLADEFGLAIAISGGRDAWTLADELAERKIPVFMTLDWGKEVEDPDAKQDSSKEKKDSEESSGSEEADETAEERADEQSAEGPDEEARWIYEEPLGARREQRLRWLEKRNSAIRLHEAGVQLAFGSGTESPAELLKRVRTLVEEGLPVGAALTALTRTPAEQFGMERHLGLLQPGQLASIALWTEQPFAKNAKVAWIVVDGIVYEFDVDTSKQDPPAEGVDLDGSWDVTIDSEGEKSSAELVLTMSEDGAVEGTYSAENTFDPGTPLRGEISGRVSGTSVTLETEISMGEMSMKLEMTGKFQGGAFSGDLNLKGEQWESASTYSATRKPENGGGQ